MGKPVDDTPASRGVTRLILPALASVNLTVVSMLTAADPAVA